MLGAHEIKKGREALFYRSKSRPQHAEKADKRGGETYIFVTQKAILKRLMIGRLESKVHKSIDLSFYIFFISLS
jgi:hypothetical protein